MIINNILYESCADKGLICIYTNQENTDKFIVGSIEFCNDEKVLVHCYDPDGHDDGYIAFYISSIFLVEINNAYIHDMSKKIKRESSEVLKKQTSDVFLTLLNYAYENHRIVSIQLFNSGFDDIVGYVLSIDDEAAQFDYINEDGEINGQSICRLSAITSVELKSKEYHS